MATTKIQSGAFPTDVVNTAAIDDLAVTHAKLHTTMDLSSKTVTLPALSQTIVNSSHIQIGGNLDVVGQIGAYDNPGSSWGTMILRATDFEFKNAGGTIKMVLNTSGNVGIGTSSNIDSNLHVVDGTAQINIEGTSGDATLKLESTGNSYWNIFNDQSDARKLKFEDNGNGVALTIQRDGNVGIGNTSPESKLNIGTPDKGVGNLGMLHTQGVIETQGGSPTSMTTTDGNNGILWRHDGWGVDNTSTGNRFLAYLANSDASLIFANNSFSPKFTIAQNGNVGIGTTNGDVTNDGTGSRTYVGIIGSGNRGRLNLGSTAANGADSGVISFVNGANELGSINVDTNSGVQNAGKMYITSSDDILIRSMSDITYQTTYTNSTAGHHIFKSYNTEIMRIDGANNRVGIGETNPLGKLHVKSADSGATADSSADEFIIEGSGNVGMSILSGASNTGSIYFGDSGTNWDGYIAYSQLSRSMTLGTNAGVNGLGLSATKGRHNWIIHENWGTSNYNMGMTAGTVFQRKGNIADDVKIRVFQGTYTYSGGSIEYVIRKTGGYQHNVGSGVIYFNAREGDSGHTIVGTNVGGDIVVNGDTSTGTNADGKFTFNIRATNGDSHISINNRLGSVVNMTLKFNLIYTG